MSDRNDVTLWASDLMLDDLLARAGDWSRRPEAERLDFFPEWEEMMDRLTGVAEDGDADRLTSDQRNRLDRLATRLVGARSVIEQLGLDYPAHERVSLAS
jgi:hypothetical protein